jgi:hypothetical protein
MVGDKYHVFTSVNNFTYPDGVFDSWREAKEARNAAFFASESVKSAWIMRSNPSLNLRQDKYGHTMRKERK